MDMLYLHYLTLYRVGTNYKSSATAAMANRG